MEAVNYYHKALHLGCCSSPRSASVFEPRDSYKENSYKRNSVQMFEVLNTPLVAITAARKIKFWLTMWKIGLFQRFTVSFHIETSQLNCLTSIPPWNHLKIYGFLMISGGIEVKQINWLVSIWREQSINEIITKFIELKFKKRIDDFLQWTS